MVAKSAFKAYDSFNNSDVSSHKHVIPPWCSSRKLTERRKLSPNWEIQSSYPLRENIWEYLYDGENLKLRSKRRFRKTYKQEKCYKKKIRLIFFIFLGLAGIIGCLWKLYPTQSAKLLTKIVRVKLLTVDWENPSVGEECCHKMRHLALELLQAKRNLRNTFRLRMTAMSTSRVKLEKPTNPNSYYIEGATANKGANTEEWAGRVTLWGVIPMWRASPPPDTVLALREATPADCWPFSGSSGELHIQLSRIQRVTSVSVEHVRPDTARSAPKRFVINGLLANNTEIELVNSKYSHYGPAKQYFATCTNAPLKEVILKVLTNHGNLKYTCIYRIHLYGTREVNKIEQVNKIV